jgi:predicted nucleic acid-binding Zn ribbon protein
MLTIRKKYVKFLQFIWTFGGNLLYYYSGSNPITIYLEVCICMPVYTYRREDGTTFDIQQKFLDEPLTIDPTTGQKVVRIIQAPGIIFKGSGFYVNDSKSASKSSISTSNGHKTENGGNGGNSSSSESKSESKPEAKTETKTESKAETKTAD